MLNIFMEYWMQRHDMNAHVYSRVVQSHHLIRTISQTLYIMKMSKCITLYIAEKNHRTRALSSKDFIAGLLEQHEDEFINMENTINTNVGNDKLLIESVSEKLMVGYCFV